MAAYDASHILLATLGGQPQVVTFTLDLLLRRGIPIGEVHVIHPAAYPNVKQAIARLNAEFVGDRYMFAGETRTIHFRQHVLRYYGNTIDDIVDEQTANGALDTIGELIQELKQRQYTVHFSVTGGRRLMTVLSFSAALLYFKPADQLLHLYTPQPVQERAKRERLMHVVPEDGVRLIEVPFARAAQPILSHLLTSSTSTVVPATTVIVEQNTLQESEEHVLCKQVVDAIKGRPLTVLKKLAKGKHPTIVARELGLGTSTISTYTNAIYRECRNVWNVPEQERVDYRFIHAKFAHYFSDD